MLPTVRSVSEFPKRMKADSHTSTVEEKTLPLNVVLDLPKSKILCSGRTPWTRRNWLIILCLFRCLFNLCCVQEGIFCSIRVMSDFFSYFYLPLALCILPRMFVFKNLSP